MANTIRELVEEAEPADVTEQEIAELRAELDLALTEALSGWDRPDGPLRITKDRLRRGGTCPAQLIGGGSAPMNEPMAVGRVIDVAAVRHRCCSKHSSRDERPRCVSDRDME